MQNLITTVPADLLTISARDLHTILPELSVMFIEGGAKEAKKPLFISILAHGNEYTGLLVLQKLLKKYGTKNWPRPVYVLFGNVMGAKEGRRHLDDQMDFNRIWKKGDHPQSARALEILAFMRQADLFASIDIHNNTGRNPLYSIVTDLSDPKHLNLAQIFGPLSMYFGNKLGTVTENFTEMCPSVTLEAGIAGEERGTEGAFNFVDKVLNLDEIPQLPVAQVKIDLMDTVGTIKIPAEASVGLGQDQADFVFESDFDKLNFKELPAGSVFAECANGQRLTFTDLEQHDLASDYFEYHEGKIVTKQNMIPAMITLDKKILKSDCVCYVMKKMQL